MADLTPPDIITPPFNEAKTNEILQEVKGLDRLSGIKHKFKPALDECSSIRETYNQWQNLGYHFIGGYPDGSTIAYNQETNQLMVFFNKKPENDALDNPVLNMVFTDLVNAMDLGNISHGYQKLRVGAVHCPNSKIAMTGMTAVRAIPAGVRILTNKGEFGTYTASPDVFKDSLDKMGHAINIVNSNDPVVICKVIEEYRKFTILQSQDLMGFFRSIENLTAPDGSPLKVSIRGQKNFESRK
jgi:hypothetical protein